MVSLARWLPAVAAAVVVALVAATLPLGPISRAIAVACVIAAFAAATFLKRRDVRAHASVVAGIAGVTAAGQVEGGLFYGVAASGFLIASLYALRIARRQNDGPPIARRPLIVILGVAGAVLGVGVATLPPIARKVEQMVIGAFGGDFTAETTAFSTTMTLGATKGMLQSDAIVARIDGPPPRYLRGAVYDQYDGGRWTSIGGRTFTKLAGHPGGSDSITLDRHAPVGNDMRWFTPVDACNFDRTVDVDAFGIVRRGKTESPPRLAYSTSGCKPPPVSPPTEQDVFVLPRFAERLGPIAAEWTAGRASDHDKLKAIEERLSHFEYSLSVERSKNIDAIVDFVTIHQAGHCEMFASAMVLLARTQGIPARVVGGYRVSEVNPITHQSVVRDRNAHAWVETWQDGAWHAWDPTPMSDGPGAARSFLDHAGDLWALAWDRLRELTALGIGVALLALIAVLVAIRSATMWVRRPRRRQNEQVMDRPLPCFEVLSEKLAKAGFTREPSEPIEAFADRIPDKNAAAALIAYAAFRYGNIGDEASIARAAEKAAGAISSSSS